MQILWISYINSWTPTLANSIKKGNKLSIIVPTGGKNVDYEQVDDIDYYYLHIRSKDTMKRMSRNNFERYQTVITKVTPGYHSRTWHRAKFCPNPKLHLHTRHYIYSRHITSIQTI